MKTAIINLLAEKGERFSASHTEFLELKSRIQAWNGLVNMFVHPLYILWTQGGVSYKPNFPGDIEQIKKIERRLLHILSTPPEQCPPLIILEENPRINLFKAWLERNKHIIKHSVIYSIPTLQDCAVPQQKLPPWCDDIFGSTARTSWRLCNDKFKELGIISIVIGGYELKVLPRVRDDYGSMHALGKCVGIAMTFLSNQKLGPFDVSVSEFVYPKESRQAYYQIFPESTYSFSSAPV